MSEQPKRKGRILKSVRSDIPTELLGLPAGQIVDLVFNPHGAASALIGGQTLGLKPDEYEELSDQPKEHGGN